MHMHKLTKFMATQFFLVPNKPHVVTTYSGHIEGTRYNIVGP